MLKAKQVTINEDVAFDPEKPICGFIGAGNYASRILIPAFTKADAQMHTIVSSGGVSATFHGKKNGFQKAATDVVEVFNNDEINTVVIVTRHNTHADYVIKALKAGKNVFVEKPLCLNDDELQEINKVYSSIVIRQSSFVNLQCLY